MNKSRQRRSAGYSLLLASVVGGTLWLSPCARAEWMHGSYTNFATYTDTNNWVGGVIDDQITTNTTITTISPNTSALFSWKFPTDHVTGTAGMLFDYTIGNGPYLILASDGGSVHTLTLNGDFRGTVPGGRFGTGGTGGINLDLGGGKRTFTVADNMRFEGGDISNGAVVIESGLNALDKYTLPHMDVGGDSYKGVIYYGAKSYTGDTEVTSGPLRMTPDGGGAPYSASFTVREGALLQIGTARDDVAVDRAGDDAPIELFSAAYLDLRYGSTNDAGTEDLGPISMNGQCFLYMGRNIDATTDFTVTADRLERVDRSVAYLDSFGFPSSDKAIRTNFTGDAIARLKFDEALPVIGGGGVAGTTSISVVPFISGRDSDVSLTTYNTTEGLRVLKLATEMVTVTNATEFMAVNANDNVLVGELGIGENITVTMTSDKTVNALILRDGHPHSITLDGAHKLSVTSGAVYFSGVYSGFLATDTLDFGTAEGIIQVTGNLRADARKEVNAVIEGSGGLTVGLQNNPLHNNAISGYLLLKGQNTYSGPTTITRGDILLFGDERLPDATVATVHSQAALEFYDTETLAGVAGDGTLRLSPRPTAACVLGSGTATAGQVTLETGGSITVDSDDSLSIDGGDLVVDDGTWTIGISSDTSAGRVDVASNLTFNADALTVSLEDGYLHQEPASWNIASATTITGLPRISGYTLAVIPGTPQILRLSWAPPAGTVISIR